MSINISQAIFYPNILTGKIVAVDLFAQKIELLSVFSDITINFYDLLISFTIH